MNYYALIELLLKSDKKKEKGIITPLHKNNERWPFENFQILPDQLC